MACVMRQICRRFHRPLQTSSLLHSNTVALAHSSWFCLPDQGMENFELLARGSAFMVHGPTTGVPIAVVSAHVAAPHRFPSYFPQEWLQHVTDADCRSMLEVRDGDRSSKSTDHALAAGFRHAKLDVAAFLLDEEAQDRLADVQVLTIGEDADTNAEVCVHGIRLIGQSGSGSEGLVGVDLNGEVKEVTGSRGFIDTGNVESEMGMCGGPVVQNGKCVGLLEGLVPRPKDGEKVGEVHERLGGCSVYIGARELRMFLHDVETETARGSEAKGVESGTK